MMIAMRGMGAVGMHTTGKIAHYWSNVGECWDGMEGEYLASCDCKLVSTPLLLVGLRQLLPGVA